MRQGKYPFIAGFLFAPVVLYLVFVIWPYVQTFGYSLTDWSGQSQTFEFVGLDNYRALLDDAVFLRALRTNAQFLVFVPLLTIVIALFFAFMTNVGGRSRAGGVQGVRGARFYRVVFFFPQVLSIAILAILFQAVYRSDEAGLLNGVLIRLGLSDPSAPVEWLNDPDLVRWCLIFVLVWSGVGFYMVLFSAAMQSIPRDVFEAALLDGAGRLQTFTRVTLPLLWDTVQTAWVFLAILAMDAFVLVATLTPGQYGGGPDHNSEVLATYLMRNFNIYGNAGYACAIGVVMLVFTLLVSVITLRAGRRERIEY
ncbi:sugar ABC transporter permease [Streptomyces sp. TRM 70351]|uniref:carbohydrate ABC transporter permease n=1 Tax=Streptomyces sp. TRM 70351 TaxID=3116552 RepID=UPI002E7B8B8A|nr:sugar ABC transporter permease [Streptomyces sp. TRM 70351]MEE1926782.1 sugar ABC transporter permease [Streptomyces sp. TRM 70351]